jgi:hypothetical protein
MPSRQAREVVLGITRTSFYSMWCTASLAALALATGACTKPSQATTMYARHKIDVPMISASYKYGDAIKFERCSPIACYGTTNGTPYSVRLEDLQETAPMKGPVYVWDEEGIDATKPHDIDDYQVAQSLFHLPDVDKWVSGNSLKIRPEGLREREDRRAAQEAEIAHEAQLEKEREAQRLVEAKEQAARDKANREAEVRQARRELAVENAHGAGAGRMATILTGRLYCLSGSAVEDYIRAQDDPDNESSRAGLYDVLWVRKVCDFTQAPIQVEVIAAGLSYAQVRVLSGDSDWRHGSKVPWGGSQLFVKTKDV